MYSILRRYAWLGLVALLAAACQRNFVYLSTPTGGVPGTPVPERTTTLLETTGTVETRTSENAAWTPASQGQLFTEGSQVRTGPGGRAVIGLTEGSRIYIDSDTEMAVTLLNPYLDSQLTVLDLLSGRTWVLLTSGSLDVQTPFGIATGRATNGAANLSAEYRPDSRTVNITCLEGICGFGSILIPSGYKLANAATNESPEPMEMADLGVWGQAVPEETQLAYLGTEAVMQGSATLPVVATSTPTSSATPSATATDTPQPTATDTLAPETPSSTPEPPTVTLEPSPTAFPSPTEPVFQPTVTPRPFTPIPPAPIIGRHTALPGETMFCIGRAYGVLPAAIAQANGLSFTALIRSGQVLVIPAVQWVTITGTTVCPTQFTSPFPGLVVATATPVDTATPAGPPLTVSVVFNCIGNCGSSEGTYDVQVDVFVDGGIGPYAYNPAQSFVVTFPHCTNGSGTVSVTSADGQTASASWRYDDVSCPQPPPNLGHMSQPPTQPPPGRAPARPGDKPMTRRGCVTGLLVWLVIITVPFCLVLFAIRGDVSWRRSDLVQDRLWLINQADVPGQESAGGVAYSATRLTASANAPAGAVCARTTVYFLLWRGNSETLAYCECYQPRPAPQTGYDSLGLCP